MNRHFSADSSSLPFSLPLSLSMAQNSYHCCKFTIPISIRRSSAISQEYTRFNGKNGQSAPCPTFLPQPLSANAGQASPQHLARKLPAKILKRFCLIYPLALPSPQRISVFFSLALAFFDRSGRRRQKCAAYCTTPFAKLSTRAAPCNGRAPHTPCGYPALLSFPVPLPLLPFSLLCVLLRAAGDRA